MLENLRKIIHRIYYDESNKEESFSRILAFLGWQIWKRTMERPLHLQLFCRIAADLNINLIDLTPAFRAVAIKGELIYYPFDTHWNHLGRQIAAQLITTRLRGIEAGASDN